VTASLFAAMSEIEPKRGDLWWVDLDPVVGREQAGRRPAVIVSSDDFLATGANRAAIVPVTTKYRDLPSWVAIEAASLREPSWALPDQIRTVDFGRLKQRIGRVDDDALAEIDLVLRLVLDL
jgi:mRNA interferase MazF